MSSARLIDRTLTDFFRDLLQTAMRARAVTSSEDTEFYLVSLLERFAHPQPDWNDRPLALEYLESLQSSPPHRYIKLKHVGDTSLFLSGIFMDRLERQLVSTDYYIALGRLAYQQLSVGPATRRKMFTEMAERFPVFVDVLAEISFEQLFKGAMQTVRIYTRWLRTRAAQDARWLMRRGIVPVDPGSRFRH